MFSKMICPGTFALSPGSPFFCPLLSCSSKSPTILLAPPHHQPPYCRAQPSSTRSHTFLSSGEPYRPPPPWQPPSLSRLQALCYQARSLCPTLVYQKSGPFSQPWMSKSMHLEQATALGAKQSGMHDVLWNPFPDKFRISGSARALDQWMGTCVTNQKLLLGECLGGEICSLLLWQPKAPTKFLQGWPESKPLLYVLNLETA